MRREREKRSKGGSKRKRAIFFYYFCCQHVHVYNKRVSLKGQSTNIFVLEQKDTQSQRESAHGSVFAVNMYMFITKHVYVHNVYTYITLSLFLAAQSTNILLQEQKEIQSQRKSAMERARVKEKVTREKQRKNKNTTKHARMH